MLLPSFSLTDQVRPSNFTIWATGSTIDQGYALYQTDTQNKWVVVSKDSKVTPKNTGHLFL